MSVRKHVKNFAEHTSMHGVGRIILTKKPEKRVAWVIVFVAAWALFAIQLTSVLTKYFEYSKKTTTEFVAGGAPFPAVTLCNKQSLDFYVIHEFLKRLEGHTENLNETVADFVRPYSYHPWLLYTVISKYLRRNPLNLSENSEYHKIFSRTTFAVNLPKHVVEEIAIKQNEFIVKCTYGDSRCNFAEIPDPYYLKCFTFEPPNIGNTSFESLQSLSEGIANGLSVTLLTGIKFSDSIATKQWLPGVYEKSSPLSGSSGIRVVIHPPGTEPFPLTEGYDVPPGFQASIGIVPERRKRLGKPHGLCARKNRYKTNYLRELHGIETDEHEPYRKISCERMCMQQQVIKECNCFDETLPVMGNAECNDDVCWFVEKNNERYSDRQIRKVKTCRIIASIEDCAVNDKCNATIIADIFKNIRCANGVIKRLMTDIASLSKCNCYPPCDEFRYHASYSLAKWPSAGYDSGSVSSDIFEDEQFIKRFADDKRAMYEEYVNRSDLQSMNDFAKINVYITDSNVLEIVEEPATTVTQLISEIGGQLGIWIGVSVITISEIIETFLTIAAAGSRKLYRKIRVRIKNRKDETQTGPNFV